MNGLLFDPSRYEKRKPAIQEAFEKDYRDILLRVKSFIDEAFHLTNAVLSEIPPYCRDKSLFAMLMSGFMTGAVRKYFPDIAGFDGNGRTLLSKDNNFAVYFKKLDNKRRPNNVRTEHSEMLFNQMAMPGADQIPIVFVGYTVDDAKAIITGYYAVCIDGNQILWTSDISSLGNSGDTSDTPIIPMLPISPAQPKKERLRVVKKKRETGE